jgi:hypothetical protein
MAAMQAPTLAEEAAVEDIQVLMEVYLEVATLLFVIR